ncbi:MAG: alpha/beta hydrolase [SAR324 cluster bacterium]|nr:alpha/beta hydrolase [SAR324 cluster bacterium]
MLKKVATRTIDDLLFDFSPHKTKDIKLRELCERIYSLFQQCASPSGKNLVEVLEDINETHYQYIFEKICQHVRQKYYHSLSDGLKQNRSYVKEYENEFFLANYQSLRDILGLFKLHENHKRMPTYLQKRVSEKMVTTLYEEIIPKSRILYTHRHNLLRALDNKIETIELIDYHYDGEPIPLFIKNIYIHKINKFQGYSIKVWEITPAKVTQPTPVCLIPGVSGNYFSFHCIGNNSLDYHLVKEGSRVFVLDHDWEGHNASMDFYAEYLMTAIIDFVKHRTARSQVMLLGHGLGGSMILFNQVLNAVQHPRLIDAVKAILLVNTPITINSNHPLFKKLKKTAEFAVSMLDRQKYFSIKKTTSLLARFPGLISLLSVDFQLNTKMVEWVEQQTQQHLPWEGNHFQFNPFTNHPQALKTLLERGMTDPPHMVLKHLLHILNSGVDGMVSANYEEVHSAADGEIKDIQKDWEHEWEHNTPSSQVLGINYTENLYRIQGNVPILAVHASNDVLCPPSGFLKYWDSLPHLNKLKLDSSPRDFSNQESNLREIERFIESGRCSSAIHVTVHEGQHLDSLITQKRVFSTFIHAVEQLPMKPEEAVRKELKVFQEWMNKDISVEKKLILTKDLSNKIRALEPHFFMSETMKIIDILLEVLLLEIPLPGYDKIFQDLMVRGDEQMAEPEELKHNVYWCTIQTIISLEPDPQELMGIVLERLREGKKLPDVTVRTFLDLGSALYDYSLTRKKELTQAVMTLFEAIMMEGIKHSNSKVALHAVRGFFHTRNSDFIHKGIDLYLGFPKAWKDKTRTIYWDEINKFISESLHHTSEDIVSSMEAFLKLYDEIGTHAEQSGV